MFTEINILFAGVNGETLELIREHLNSDGIHGVVDSINEFGDLQDKLKKSFDILILDVDAAPFSDDKAIEQIKNNTGNISLILIAENADKARIRQAMKVGILDIIEKDIPERLISVIKREAENIQLQRNQVKAYHRVLESEARYRAIFERTGTAKCLFNSDGTIQLANSQFMRLTGLEAAHIEGKQKWLELIFKEDRSKFKPISDLVQSGKAYLPWKEEFRLVDAGGTMKFLIGTFSLIPETGEHILSIVDITGLKRVQKRLKQSEKRLAAAQKMAHLGNWEWNIDSGRIIWSEEIYRIMGVDPDKFTPSFKSFLDLVYSQDQSKVRRAIRNSFFQGKPYSVEHRIKTPQGKEKILHERGTVIRDRQGKPVRMVGTVQDISRRSHMEEQNRRLAAAVFNIREGILLYDTGGHILFANPALENILGFSSGDLIGKSIDDLKLIENIEEAGHINKKKRPVFGGQTSYQKKDGEKIDIDVFLSPIRESRRSKNILFTVLVLRDITAEVRMEKYLRRTHKMEALGTLAGGISHDLNNILMPIVLNTELALWELEDDDQVKDYLKQVLIASKRGKELVNQVVSFSRQKPDEMKPVHLIPLIKEALRLMQASIPAGIKLHACYQTDNDLVYGNPTQIHQVLMNLCSNASQALEDERGRIEVVLESIHLNQKIIKLYPSLTSGSYVKLSVTDTGCGIPEKIFDKIFDPFFTTKKSSEGSGMGLAVVDGIVRKHQGIVNVYSEAGEGSTFNVFFPALDENVQETKEESFDFHGGNEHIYVIDDEPFLLKSLQKVLEKLGYTVTTSDSPSAGLNEFQLHPEKYDLILTDQTMPEMTGLELTHRIKCADKDMPVILISGFNEKINEKELKKAGIAKYLAKPVDTAKLARSIRSVLTKNQKKGEK